MKIRARITDGRATWEEVYADKMTNPKCYMGTILRRFNDGLRDKERPRVLVSVAVLDREDDGRQHDWEKTNIITLVNSRDGYYDRYRCRNCLVAARRYGVGPIQRERAFMAGKYETCSRKNKVA